VKLLGDRGYGPYVGDIADIAAVGS